MKNKTASIIVAIIFTAFLTLLLSATASAFSVSSANTISHIYTSVLEIVSALTAVSVVLLIAGAVYSSFYRYVDWMRHLYNTTNTIHHR